MTVLTAANLAEPGGNPGSGHSYLGFSLVETVGLFLLLVGVHLMSNFNYLLFHSAAELFSIFIAVTVGIMGLAAAFKREVIAEGVETVAHGTELMRLGCQLAQGYGIARPMPAEHIPAWAATWKPDAAWCSLYSADGD